MNNTRYHTSNMHRKIKLYCSEFCSFHYIKLNDPFTVEATRRCFPFSFHYVEMDKRIVIQYEFSSMDCDRLQLSTMSFPVLVKKGCILSYPDLLSYFFFTVTSCASYIKIDMNFTYF
jgi:hypothetical protein